MCIELFQSKILIHQVLKKLVDQNESIDTPQLLACTKLSFLLSEWQDLNKKLQKPRPVETAGQSQTAKTAMFLG